jgi:signal transduction histidine kinase
MKNIRVLVVDDEPGICSGVKRILSKFTVSYPFMDEDRGFDVIDSSTGEDAIEIIKENPPDIVLLDNKLPGIQGTEVLDFINQNHRNVMVLMITSYASLELAVEATNQGAYDFIPKPFTPQELKAALENVTKHIFLRSMTQKMNKEGKEVRFQFLSVLSHELKSPLNAIEGYMNMMKERQAGEELENYDKVIDRSLERIKGMRALIMDLLDLTKIQFEKQEQRLEQVHLNHLLNNAIEAINPYAIQKDVNINVHADQDIYVNADPNDIEIVMNNLISNAVKYNKDKGTVDVYLEKKKDEIEMIFQDTGIGMNEDEKSKLFTEFFRVKSEKTKKISGSGLGLSIVKRIIDLYNGQIRVDSKPDKGSTFFVKIPVK